MPRKSAGLRLSSSGATPALDARIVFAARFDPTGAGGALFELPEGRAGFQIIHQELRGLEGGMPVTGGDTDKDDAFARRQPSDAMHDSQSENRPARFRFGDMGRD